MKGSGQEIADRRRLKRSVTIWRVGAILAFAAALLAFMGRSEFGDMPVERHIARISLEGILVGETDILDTIAAVAEDEQAEALIVYIDSPGGTSADAEAIYEALRKVAEKKPVVAQMGTVAASGGYIAALAADHIVARGNTLTGSIGVIMQWTELEELFGKLGLEMRTVKSAVLKGEPDPFSDPSPEALAMTRALIDSSYDWFLGLVETRREFSKEKARTLGDGSVFTGFQAQANGLVDEIGGEETVLAWLESEKKIDKSLAIYEYEPEPESWGSGLFMDSMVQLAARFLGLEGVIENSASPVSMNGLVSIWNPSLR